MSHQTAVNLTARSPGPGTRKKMLYLSVCDPDLQVTGATVRMGAFVRHLAHRYDISLVHMEGSGYRVAHQVGLRHGAMSALGVSRRVRIPFSQPGYFLFSPALYRAADRLLSAEQFDYLFADYGLAGAYGASLARRHGVPLIYGSMNVEYAKYLEQMKTDVLRGVLAPWVFLAERAACRTARLVVAISEQDRDAYTRWIPAERVEVIYQGFDPAVSHPGDPPPSSPAVVLFVGNMRLEHNRKAAMHIARRILPEVVRARPDVVFQFVGDQPPEGLAGPHVECTGFVEDLLAHLHRANLVIAPMPFGFGMSTKIISAVAVGRTVLTTPQGAGAIPRRYRQMVVAPLEEFGTRIVELLDHPVPMTAGEYEALCAEFAWPSLIDRLVRRIESSCGTLASR